MNILRHNITTLLLTLVVAGVTACNSYCTKADRDMYMDGVYYNNAQMAANKLTRDTQLILGQRERQVLELAGAVRTEQARSQQLEQLLSVAAHHIRDCHALLAQQQKAPPATELQLQKCPADCEKCPERKVPDAGRPTFGKQDKAA